MSDRGGAVAHMVVERNEFTLDVGLVLAAGRTAVLLGPNGAGKSTVVQALAGLVPLDAGSIVLNGVVVDAPDSGAFVPPSVRSVGVVFQDYILFPHLSVLENVAFGLRSRGVRRGEAQRRAHAWLEHLEIDDLSKIRPANLSGGQAQRVALARALAPQPALLLLDEPLAALDVSTRAEMRHTLATHLRSFPGARLMITHDPMEAFLFGDEIYVIESGSITQSGTADEIRLSPRTPYAADLAGANLLAGRAHQGIVDVDGHPLHIADPSLAGPVLATIHSRAIALHRTQPSGSPRNTWPTTVARLEHYGDRVRVRTGAPLTLTAEVTPEAVRSLDLGVGSEVWVSIKATEIATVLD